MDKRAFHFPNLMGFKLTWIDMLQDEICLLENATIFRHFAKIKNLLLRQ